MYVFGFYCSIFFFFLQASKTGCTATVVQSETLVQQDFQVEGEREWEKVSEEEGKVEGTQTPALTLRNVQKCNAGVYCCKVVYKGCSVTSEAASLSVVGDGE